jgi:hypothetical protein
MNKPPFWVVEKGGLIDYVFLQNPSLTLEYAAEVRGEETNAYISRILMSGEESKRLLATSGFYV